MTLNEFFAKLDKGATWSAGVSFERANPLPLDKYSVFQSLEAAQQYTKNPVAYPGQVVAVVAEAGSKVYFINEQMALEPIGIIPSGEEGVVEVDEQGKITLHGYLDATPGFIPQKTSNGLKWIAISEVVQGDGNTVTEGDKVTIDTVGDEKKLTASLHGFGSAKEGQIPYKTNGALTWKTPEQYNDTEIKNDIAAIKKDYATTTSVTEAIANAKLGQLKRVVLEDYSALPGVGDADTIYMVPRSTIPGPEPLAVAEVSDVYVEYFWMENKWEILGDTTVDLKDYAKKSEVETVQSNLDTYKKNNDAALDKKLDVSTAATTYATQEALGQKADQSDLTKLNQTVADHTSTLTEQAKSIQALTQTGAEKNVINAVSDEFAISSDESRTLSVAAINKSKVTGLAEALADKVDAVDGHRLMTDAEGALIKHISASEDGAASFDGKVEASNVNGLTSWVTTNRDKTPGLLSAENASKLGGIEAEAQVNKIESITLEGASDALIISQKAVTLPKATTEKIGLVKLSAEIGTDENGGLNVKGLDVNKLTQLPDTYIVLNGGDSVKNIASKAAE